MTKKSSIALVTGAAGGIGSACARRLGQTHALFLADRDESRLGELAEALAETGFHIAGTHASDLGERGVAEAVVSSARQHGPLATLVHTAGLSPAQGEAKALLRLNAYATEALLDAAERGLEKGLSAVLIASMAGHLAQPDEEFDTLFASLNDEKSLHDAVELIAARTGNTTGREAADIAYLYTKRANILSAMRRSANWAKHDARINTISPGLVSTDMGRLEVKGDKGAAEMLAMQPLGWVSADDVAETVTFLTSRASKAITGADIKVDGGVLALVFANKSVAL